LHGFFAVDGPASRRKFVFGIVFLGASRWPPQIVIRYATRSIHLTISGLNYVPAFVNAALEAELLTAIDGSTWLTDLKRRVQHYGYRYDYKARKVEQSAYLGPLPSWAQPLAIRLAEDGYMSAPPDQLIINGAMKRAMKRGRS
jgi:hypothetical protein